MSTKNDDEIDGWLRNFEKVTGRVSPTRRKKDQPYELAAARLRHDALENNLA